MLNKVQRKVAFDISGNTIVSASPGTGKTKTLVARAQYKLETLPPHKSLALITYTNAAADEISSRLITNDSKGVFIGTIHRFCLEFILRPFGWINKWDKPRIITYDDLVEFLEINEDMDLGNSPLDELSKIKKQLNGNLDQNVDWSNTKSLEYVADLFHDFLKSKGAIDFNEILYRSYKLINENDFITTSLASKFYEISIDEFQDTNIFQYEIFKIINKKKVCTFFLVGDPKQRIYRFAGAIDDAFKKASSDFSAKINELEVTYRSTSNIILTYSKLFGNHPKLINESQYKDVDYPIIIKETNSDNNTAFIDFYISKLLKNNSFSLSQIAILTTSWFDAINISRVLRQKYHVVGLGALPHRHINNSTFNLLRSLSRHICSTSIKNLRIVKRNVELHSLENNLNLDDHQLIYITNSLISEINNFSKSISLHTGLEKLKLIFDKSFGIKHSSFDEIIGLINDDEAQNWTVGKYFETLSGISGITINTIHQSKGLEYDVVILNGINEGRIPYQAWDAVNRRREPLLERNLEDGKTLLYVGLSRAKVVQIILHGWNPSMFIQLVK